MALSPNSLARRKPGVQIPSPPPPNLQVRASSASSGRRSLHAAAAPRPHAQVAVQPRRLAATRRLGPRPHTMTTQGSRCLAAHPGSPPTGDPPAHPADPGRPRARPSHDPTTAHDDGQVQADPSAGPARPAPGSTARLRPGPTTNWPWTPPTTTPTPAIPATRLPAHRHLSTTSRPDTVDAETHGHRTPTLDTGHLDAQTPTPDTGQRPRGQARVMLDTRTRQWTPDAGRGPRHADEGTAGIRTSWATMPSAPAGPPHPCSCGQRRRRLATMTARRWATCQRETASRTTSQLLGRSAGQAAPRRTALLRLNSRVLRKAMRQRRVRWY